MFRLTNHFRQSHAIVARTTQRMVGMMNTNNDYFRMSTAATVMDDEEEERGNTIKNKNRRSKRPDAIIVTKNAANRISELMSGADGDPIGIRLGVKRRGCNGLSYTLNYAYDENPKEEQVIVSPEIKIMIEPMALFSVVGTTMDYVETELSSEFTFENPNSKGECGCGESFTV